MIIPSVGEWVEFTYQKISTFPQKDGTDRIVLSNPYPVKGQVSYVGKQYIDVGTLRRGGVTFRSYRFDRMNGSLEVVESLGDIIPPDKLGKSPAPKREKQEVPQLGEGGFEC